MTSLPLSSLIEFGFTSDTLLIMVIVQFHLHLCELFYVQGTWILMLHQSVRALQQSSIVLDIFYSILAVLTIIPPFTNWVFWLLFCNFTTCRELLHISLPKRVLAVMAYGPHFNLYVSRYLKYLMRKVFFFFILKFCRHGVVKRTSI